MKSIIYIGVFFLLFGCKQNERPQDLAEAAEAELKVVHPWADKASYQNAPDVLKIWVDARAGTGEPVHWVADGGVYEYPTGKILIARP